MLVSFSSALIMIFLGVRVIVSLYPSMSLLIDSYLGISNQIYYLLCYVIFIVDYFIKEQSVIESSFINVIDFFGRILN